MAIYQLDDRIPHIDPASFVHELAAIIGLVTVGAGATVWPGATIRGDNEPILIGDNTSVQEGAVLHTDPGCPLTIGRNVTIGHQAMLHGCAIGDGSLIGIQAIVLNRAVIGRNCLIGAGALVTEGKVIPDNCLVLGSPAKVTRELTPEDVQRLQASAASYVRRARQYPLGLKRIG